MNRFASLSLLPVLMLTMSSYAQDYKVLKVIGGIEYRTTGNAMKTGDQFAESEPLEYSSNSSKAFVFGNDGSRKVLSAGGAGNSLLPAMNNISSRSGALVNKLDVEKHFSGSYLVLGQNEVIMPKAVYPISSSSFFYIEYQHNGETINKKLAGADSNKVVIDVADLYTIDGQPVERPASKAVKLWYLANGESEVAAEFELVTPDESAVREELAVMADGVADPCKNKIFIENANLYLTEAYGKTHKKSVLAWLGQKF